MIDLAEIKSRINPAYQDVRGTESHERKTLCDEIDRLRAENEQLGRICTACEAHCRDLIERNEALKAALQHESDVAEAFKAEADELRKDAEFLMDQIKSLKSELSTTVKSLDENWIGHKDLAELRAFKVACEGQGVFGHYETNEHGVSDWTVAGRGVALYEHPDPEAAQLRMQVSELEEKLVTQKAYYESVFEDGARRIAYLTEQRDMAVEALRSVVFGSGDWFNLMPATLHDSLCNYLDTIQSSEVKK
jgi:hypothetical protein